MTQKLSQEETTRRVLAAARAFAPQHADRDPDRIIVMVSVREDEESRTSATGMVIKGGAEDLIGSIGILVEKANLAFFQQGAAHSMSLVLNDHTTGEKMDVVNGPNQALEND